MSAANKLQMRYSHITSYIGIDRKIGYMILINLINNILLSTCYFLPIYFVKQLHIDVATAGLIVACYGIGTIIGSIISGKLSDRLSSSIIAIVSMSVQGSAFLALIYAQSTGSLIVTLLLLGAGTYSFITTHYLTALSTNTENRTQRLTIINSLDTSANLGLGLAALIIGILPTKQLSYVFATAGVILLSMSVLSIKYFPHRQIEKPAKIYSSKISGMPHTHNYLLYHVLFCLFAAGFIISQLTSIYSIYLSQLFPSNNASYFSMLFAINTLLVATLQTPIVHYLNRYDHLLVIGHGMLLLGCGVLILVLSKSLLCALLSCVIYTMGEILFFSMAQSLCYEHAPIDKKGSVLGIYRMTYALSRVVGPMMGGYLYQHMSHNSVWWLCGIFGGICFIATLYFHQHIKQPIEYSRNL